MSKSQTLINQAMTQHQAGHLAQAELMYLTILKNDSQNAKVLYLLGALRFQQDRFELAIDLFGQALALQPKMTEAVQSLGNAYLSLGNFFKTQGKFHQAEENYQKAYQLESKNLVALNNLAIVLKDQNKLDESLACYQKILQANPKAAEVFFNMGLTLKEMGRYEEALQCYDHGLALQPENAEAHFNKSRILWTMEDYGRLWPEYEWRLKTKNYQSLQNDAQKKWDGSSLQGKSLLIQGEQGIGDEILFLHCLDEILDSCQKCFVECHPKLVEIVQRSFPKAQVSARSLDGSPTPLSRDEKIDYQIPIASLMQFLRPTQESFPQKQSYLKADAQKIEFWKERLAQLGPKPKVGISWKTQANDLHNALRAKGTTDLSLWTPILRNQNCDFINLQYGDTSQDKKFVSEKLDVRIHDWEDLDQTNDLDSVSALLSSLDLVISIDSAVAYLAGALGKPVWVAAAFGFGKNAGQDQVSLWQPSVKYFLQQKAGDWGSLFTRIGENLNVRFEL